MNSVASIAKVTNAMQVVAAAQHQRLRARLLGARSFAEHSWRLLGRLAAAGGDVVGDDPVFNARPSTRAIALVLVSSDRGMAGDYDQALITLARRFVANQTVPVRLFTIGAYGRDALQRSGLESALDLKATIDIQPVHLATLSAELLQGYRQERFDQAQIVYGQFLGGARFSPTLRQLLPIRPDQAARRQCLLEPSAERLLAELEPLVLRSQLYEALIESMTAETAARMLAMRTATRNAQDLMERLRIGYNKARQQAITSEMLDIVGGSAAVQQVSERP